MPDRRLMLRWLPPILWMGVIFFASSLPGSELRVVSAYSVLGHLGEYAVLGALLFLAARRTWPPRRAMLFAVTAASLYGVTDELHQFLTPGRTPNALDWATDTAGAALGVVVVLAVEAVLRRRGRRDLPSA